MLDGAVSERVSDAKLLHLMTSMPGRATTNPRLSSRHEPLLGRPSMTRESSTAAELILQAAEKSVGHTRAGTTGDDAGDSVQWEDYDDGTRSAHDAGFGIKFLRHQERSEYPDKVLEYHTKNLEDKPWAIAFEVLRSIVASCLIAMLFVCLSLLFEEDVMTVFTAVNATVSAGLFFLLGPFVALSLARWWQMRIEFLGGVWGAVADLNMYATIWFNSGSTADTRARELVQRYGLLAHMLLYKDARGQMGLEDAIGKGILLPEEAIVLTPLPSRSQMVFTWLMDFWSRALSEKGAETLGTTPVPHAALQAPVVLKRCLDGRGAAGGALALVYTQLPFPYVHLLSMLVQVACVINAMVQGAKTGWILSKPECSADATVAEAHKFRFEWQDGCPPAVLVYQYTATAFILMGLVVSIAIYPVIYHGLLSIGVMLANPLGTEFIDFPGSFYQHIMKAEIDGFRTCADAIQISKRGKGTRWWPGIGL